MKLKYFIVVGYLISTLTTVLAVLWAVNRMLILEKEVYFIVFITILASILGAVVSLLLLSQVFKSLDKLKRAIKGIPEQRFEMAEKIEHPTEFKELADAFNMMTIDLQSTFASLEESEQEKNLMIAQLSHDIKTPITSIQATVEAILDGVIAEDETPHYLRTIHRQTDRLNKLVEKLNDVTLNQTKTSDRVDEKEIIMLDRLLIEILSEFQYLIDKEEREIDIHVDPGVTKIYSNYDKLSRIVLNLVSNALKYSASQTKLSIEAISKDDELHIKVTDQGQGIKEEDFSRIFKRLYRVESSRNMETGGHGLGLYIAQELAHQLNGEIQVESEFGKGSQFTLVLREITSTKSQPPV